MNPVFRKPLSILASVLVLPIAAACDPGAMRGPGDTTLAPGDPAPIESPAATAPTTTTPTAGDRAIADVVATDNSLSNFNSAVAAAGLTETLREGGPYTVFAPSNEAFEAIPVEARQELLRPENRDRLRQILFYHVVQDDLQADRLRSGEVEAVAGGSLNVRVDETTRQVNVNNANVIQPDLEANNGVVHIVDRVILPPNFAL